MASSARTGTGGRGPKGDPGASAYELAVTAGFVGTEDDWLASLQGSPGEPGDPGAPGEPGEPGEGSAGAPGASAYEVAVSNGFVGDEAAWLASLVGPAGDGSGSPAIVRLLNAKDYGTAAHELTVMNYQPHFATRAQALVDGRTYLLRMRLEANETIRRLAFLSWVSARPDVAKAATYSKVGTMLTRETFLADARSLFDHQYGRMVDMGADYAHRGADADPVWYAAIHAAGGAMPQMLCQGFDYAGLFLNDGGGIEYPADGLAYYQMVGEPPPSIDLSSIGVDPVYLGYLNAQFWCGAA